MMIQDIFDPDKYILMMSHAIHYGMIINVIWGFHICGTHKIIIIGRINVI